MAFLGLSLEGTRDDGICLITNFAIPLGRESEAGRELLACLADGVEVCLRNDADEGGEGCTIYRRSPSGLVTMCGGHGCQSDWKPTNEAGVLVAVAELAAHNRGGLGAQGSLVRYKRRD
jgi:hypothetical protein